MSAPVNTTAVGGAVGSIWGPAGTAVGGAIGAAVGAIWDLLDGEPDPTTWTYAGTTYKATRETPNELQAINRSVAARILADWNAAGRPADWSPNTRGASDKGGTAFTGPYIGDQGVWPPASSGLLDAEGYPAHDYLWHRHRISGAGARILNTIAKTAIERARSTTVTGVTPGTSASLATLAIFGAVAFLVWRMSR